MRTIKDYISTINEALTATGKNPKPLSLQIYALAGALVALDKANAQIATLDSCTIDTPQGIKGHPVFRIRKEAEDSVTKQMKALGLTAEMIQSADEETDPLVELTKEVAAAGKIRQKKITVKGDRRGKTAAKGQ